MLFERYYRKSDLCELEWHYENEINLMSEWEFSELQRIIAILELLEENEEFLYVPSKETEQLNWNLETEGRN